MLLFGVLRKTIELSFKQPPLISCLYLISLQMRCKDIASFTVGLFISPKKFFYNLKVEYPTSILPRIIAPKKFFFFKTIYFSLKKKL